MADIHKLFSDDVVFACDCGCQDFYVVPPPDDLGCFSGFVCQECERSYAFPNFIKRCEILMVEPEENGQ